MPTIASQDERSEKGGRRSPRTSITAHRISAPVIRRPGMITLAGNSPTATFVIAKALAQQADRSRNRPQSAGERFVCMRAGP